jgi:hypothetical protein
MMSYFESFDYQDRDVVDLAGQSLGRVKVVLCGVTTRQPHWVGVEIAPAGGVEDRLHALIPVHDADTNGVTGSIRP